MPLTARCEASQWVAIIGPSSGAITAARPRPCCAALFPPAKSFGSTRSPGSATCSAASQNIPSRGSKNCCRIVGLRHPDNPTPIHPNIRKPGPHPPEGFVGCLHRSDEYAVNHGLLTLSALLDFPFQFESRRYRLHGCSRCI